MDHLTPTGRGRAASYMARVNMEIVKAAAARRQGHDQDNGARLPAALAGAPVRLEVIKGQGTNQRVTPLGYKTAKRALPPILARLAPSDPRLAAATMLADAVERVGAVKVSDLGGADSNGLPSDGGATTRIKHAARLRLIEAKANRWPVTIRHGPRKGLARVLMAPKRASGQRHKILAFDALVAVCVDGASVDAILRAHGWSAQAFNRTPLRDAILGALDDVAEGLCLTARATKKSLDPK